MTDHTEIREEWEGYAEGGLCCARAQTYIDALLAERANLTEYLAHQAWRCEYRTRYQACQCGLDDLCDRLGIERVAPDDPEEKR